MDPDRSAAALARFFTRTTAGIKPGLQVIEALSERMDHPERRFLVVHVAGTNGKGSVCALLEAILRRAGLRTGLYTSPHLVRFHERIRVDGQAMSDEDVVARAAEVEAADARQAAETGLRPATFFELGTAMAFSHFARSGVQIAVVETGMGGRWDATNVVLPLVSVITPIGLDHQEYLGDTLTAIAGEKAGILKDGRPVVLAEQAEEAKEVLLAEARTRRAPVISAPEEVEVRPARAPRGFDRLSGQRISVRSAQADYGTVTLGLLGDHQRANAAVAVAAAEQVFAALGREPEAEAVSAGLAAARWPARLQILETQPPLLLDGAHNPAGAVALAAALRDLFGERPGAFVIGLSRDKDVAGVLRPLRPWLRRAWAVAYAGDRALPPDDLAARLRGPGREVSTASLGEALAAARTWAAAEEGFVCVCGSLYLAGDVLGRPEYRHTVS
jgi:dihydrofolate synthase/folylpolyglutamate synthase